MSDAHVEDLASYVHGTCWREFDSQAELDAHIGDPIHSPCRFQEYRLLTKGFNY